MEDGHAKVFKILETCDEAILAIPLATATLVPHDSQHQWNSLHTSCLSYLLSMHDSRKEGTGPRSSADCAAVLACRARAYMVELLLPKLVLGPERLDRPAVAPKPGTIKWRLAHLLDRAKEFVVQVAAMVQQPAAPPAASPPASSAGSQAGEGAQPAGHGSAHGADSAVTARVHQLVRDGNLSKAVQCLDRSDNAGTAQVKLSVNQEELELVRRLHPGPLVPTVQAETQAAGEGEVRTPSAAASAAVPPTAAAGLVDQDPAELLGSSYPTDATLLKKALHDFRVCLRRLKRRSAAGLSGWKLEHVLHRRHNHHVLLLLTELSWRIASGQVPAAMQPFFFGARIVPVPKGAGGGVRPIAIGELFVKMAAKRLAMGPVVQRATQLLRERHQLGIGVSGGLEAAVNGAKAFLYAHPDMVLLKLDLKNAFNSISRVLIRRRLVELELNELLPYYDSRYPVQVDGEGGVGKWPTLAIPMDDGTTAHIESRTGVTQGDVLGPLFFAVGLDAVISKALEAVPIAGSSFLAAFIDDINMVASKEEALAFATALENASIVLGAQLGFNHDKCALYEPQGERAAGDQSPMEERGGESDAAPADEEAAPVAPVFQCSSTAVGVVVLGTPVGTPEFCKAFWMTTTRSIEDTIRRIKNKVTDPQIKLLLLRHCGVSKGIFLARMADPALAQVCGTDLDIAAHDALASTLAYSPSGVVLGSDDCANNMLKQARLPVRHGGLGITSIRECAMAAHMGAVAAAASALQSASVAAGDARAAPRSASSDTMAGSDDGQQAAGPVSPMQEALLQWYRGLTTEHSRGLLADFWEEVARLQVEVATKMGTGKAALTLPKCLQPPDEDELEKLPQTEADLITKAAAGDRLQHQLSDVLHRFGLALIYLGAPRQERIKIVSMTQRGASAFLNAIPTETGLMVASSYFTWMVRRRLGCSATRAEDRLAAQECVCRSGAQASEQAQEQHAFNCKLGGGNQRRHDRIRDTIADMFRMVGYNVHVEPRAQYSAFGQGGPDIEVLNFPSVGIDTFVEVSVINPASYDNDVAQREPLVAAAHREKTKTESYAADVQTMTRKALRVAVVESTGGLGLQLADLIKQLDRVFKDKHLELPETTTWTTSFIEYWRQRISVALANGAGELREKSRRKAAMVGLNDARHHLSGGRLSEPPQPPETARQSTGAHAAPHTAQTAGAPRDDAQPAGPRPPKGPEGPVLSRRQRNRRAWARKRAQRKSQAGSGKSESSNVQHTTKSDTDRQSSDDASTQASARTAATPSPQPSAPVGSSSASRPATQRPSMASRLGASSASAAAPASRGPAKRFSATGGTPPSVSSQQPLTQLRVDPTPVPPTNPLQAHTSGAQAMETNDISG